MGLVMKIRFTDVIKDGTLKNYYVNGKVCGYQFDIRLGYYRGHYLSDIEQLDVEMDGQKASSKDITFCLNGKEFSPEELKYQVSEFWTIITPATVVVRKTGGLCSGKHDLNLTLMLRSPYLPLPGATMAHTYTPIDSCERKTIVLQEEK